MAKKKATLSDDLKKITIPFDMYSAFSAVADEVIKRKKFEYGGFAIENGRPILSFKKEGHNVDVVVNKNDFLIREYKPRNGDFKLAVLHVVKPEHRTFKLR